MTITRMPTAPVTDATGNVREKARTSMGRAQALAAEGRTDEALIEYESIERLVAETVGSDAVLADAARGAGVVHLAASDWIAAQEAFERSLIVARELADEVRMARALNCLAAVAFERGDWDMARDRYREARRQAEAAEDMLLLGQIQQNEGVMHAARGDTVRAELCFRDSIEQLENAGGHPCVAKAWNNLGLVLMARERYDEAMAAFDRASHEARRSGDEIFDLKVLINLGRLTLRRGHPKDALAMAERARNRAEKIGKGPVPAGAMCLLGEIARMMNDNVGATRCFRRALELASDRSAPLIEAETWVQIGHLHQQCGKSQAAITSWTFARHLYRLLGADAEVRRLLDLIDNTTDETGGVQTAPLPVPVCA